MKNDESVGAYDTSLFYFGRSGAAAESNNERMKKRFMKRLYRCGAQMSPLLRQLAKTVIRF